MNFDPFQNPFHTGSGHFPSELFHRRTGGAKPRPIRTLPQPGAEPESLALEPENGVGPQGATEKRAEDKVVLRNPVWEVEDVGFNEETLVSVEAVLPEVHAHKTRVEFQVFAKTPGGAEFISKGEGHVRNGKAAGKLPIYFPQYRDTEGNLLGKVEFYFTAKHSQSDLLQDTTKVKVIDHLAERLIQSHVLQDVTFAMGKSFLRAGSAHALKALVKRISDWKKQHPDGKLALFGHADAVGREEPNKQLSERRADTVYGFLVKDPTIWKTLYDTEKWGLASTQELLKALEYDPGAIDGLDGPKTQQAVKAFQSNVGLPITGLADPPTQERLYRACMDAWNPESISSRDFDSIDGKARAGCSEFNLAENTEGACENNRRVSVFLLKSNRNFPIFYPCKEGDIAPCRKQKDRKGIRRTPGFSCLFYDRLITETVPFGGEISPSIDEITWEKPVLLTWDESTSPQMETRVEIRTSGMSGAQDVLLEAYQFDPGGKHVCVLSHELKLESDSLFTKDGKEFVCRIPWHRTLYDHGKHQYFCVLKIAGLEKSSPTDKAGLLRLKHSDSCVADPRGDLRGAAREGRWFKLFMEKKGPWKEATEGKTLVEGHSCEKKGSVTTAEFSTMLDGNRFIHHQSSHGSAYCLCDGRKNFLQRTNTMASDGYIEYACPVCRSAKQAIGCISLKDWDNDFFIEDVEALFYGPKTLLLANCCLTAITDTYPKAWLAKGTRWYIGWARTVGDKDAVRFAKAFYARWFNHYGMDPDSVKAAFNDVKRPYAKYHPRIYGS